MREKKPRYVEVECEFMILHCPICGASAHPDILPEEACPHLAFVHSDEYHGIVYMSDDFKERVSAVYIPDDYDDDDDQEEPPYNHMGLEGHHVQQLIEKSGYSNNLLAIEITYEQGRGCGGFGYMSDTYGFDFWAGVDDEEGDG